MLFCVSGYLAVSLFLNESHELLLLLVNTVLKVCTFLQLCNFNSKLRKCKLLNSFYFQDLQSTNLIEVCMALTVVSQIFPKEMIPAILPLVEEKLNHPK